MIIRFYLIAIGALVYCVNGFAADNFSDNNAKDALKQTAVCFQLKNCKGVSIGTVRLSDDPLNTAKQCASKFTSPTRPDGFIGQSMQDLNGACFNVLYDPIRKTISNQKVSSAPPPLKTIPPQITATPLPWIGVQCFAEKLCQGPISAVAYDYEECKNGNWPGPEMTDGLIESESFLYGGKCIDF
ncbi:hypothetical protein [Photorhabdus sp. CRCIA-P01]|uniref:hypothetical protein n=1 Tax=Photorhabdus sp. CRCIA-P01 TaxID=2019570 RepID=UPI000E59D49D|nr:hypothetical protein [Photorhabdus sp. CRCIA-P01]